MNPSITQEFGAQCETLLRYVALPEVKVRLAQAASAALRQLVLHPSSAAGVSPLDGAGLPPLPSGIAFCRIAAMRPGMEFKRERHDNSDQFLFSIAGFGETRVLRSGVWESDCYGSGEPSLETRWHVTPRNVWHQSVAHGSEPWVLAAFHTAADVHDEYVD